MQDNALCHTAKSVKTFLSEEDVTVMKWPAQSPDMNPIVWKLLNERAKEENPRNIKELWTKCCIDNNSMILLIVLMFLIIYFFECYIIILITLSK